MTSGLALEVDRGSSRKALTREASRASTFYADPVFTADDLQQAPRRHSRLRLAFFRAVESLASRLGGRRFYERVFLGPKRFVQREECLRVPGLPSDLAGFTIAHLSDFHAGPFLGPGALRHVIEVVNQRNVDLCLMTGDYLTHHWSEAVSITEDLGQLESRFGTFGVFGNHDYQDHEDDRIVEAYGGVGIQFLQDEVLRIESGNGAISLVGLSDLEEGPASDLRQIRQDVREDDVEIVLSHNPLGAAALAKLGPRAVLSGHTHGTQIDLPFLRRLGPTHPGLRVELGKTTLIVTRGVGVVGVPLRYRSPAEVVFISLEADDAR